MQWGLNVHQQPRQLDKRFSDLKLCQREQIAKWLREETNDYYTRHQRYPIGREAEDVVDNAYVQIVKAGIWIPYGEVYQYYLSRKARMMKHPQQGLNREALHMCGRFFLADNGNSGELHGIIDQLNRRGVTVKTGEIFPDGYRSCAGEQSKSARRTLFHAMGIHAAGRPPAHQRSERNGRGEAALSGRNASAPLPDSRNELFRVGKSAAGRKSSTPSGRRMQACYTWRGCTAWRTDAQYSPF